MSLNSIHCWAIITPDKEKADQILQKIKNQQLSPIAHELITQKTHLIIFENGIRVRWLYPHKALRGYRFHKLWLDKNMKQDFLNQAVYPYLYMEQQEIIWI